MAQGREATRQFYAGDLEPLWSRMTAEMREAAGGSVEEFRGFRAKVDELAGQETRVVDEDVFIEGDIAYYSRISDFDEATGPMVVQWGFERDSAIADFFIRPAEPAAAVVYRTKTELRLPFEGEWYVTAGGRTIEENQHSADYSTRFAYDLVSAAEFDWPWPRPRNEDFPTWGQPIRAPAAGVVAATRSDVPDNLPGEVDTDGAVRMGNFVSIDHGNGEFSLLGHLQSGSVRVAAGDTVRAGDVVGLAGNSGNSNGPHLHYNLQDRAEPNRGKGLPAQFTQLVVDGQEVERAEPVQGQRIRAIQR
ncbi:MAG TPA: M23 family metallopeptidase [Longimicrobiales bacterium]|nr:M23 family metallopeptidase [Longimicrobiales bacterium]